MCNEYNYKLDEFTLSNDPINCIDFESIENEDGADEGITHCNFNDNDYDCFKENNLPTSKELYHIINKLTNAMRNDIGSEKINW